MSSNARVSWAAVADAAVVAYQVFRADTQQGQYWLLATVSSDVTGPNFDANLQRFFYDDPAGTLDLYYKVVAVDGVGVARAESAPFQPSAVQDTSLANRVRVDHNYGGQDALQAEAPGGSPIAQCEIRVWREPDYLLNASSTPYAMLLTRDDGRWETPVYLPPGMNYVVQFFKPSGYGPRSVTITV